MDLSRSWKQNAASAGNVLQRRTDDCHLRRVRDPSGRLYVYHGRRGKHVQQAESRDRPGFWVGRLNGLLETARPAVDLGRLSSVANWLAVVFCASTHHREARMTQTPAELIAIDQQHLIHPLHDHTEPVIYVRGCGAKVYDIHGREYIDGLSGLWNVNVGHGRAELAEAAAAQMRDLAYFSAY